ncbi:DnaB-like helicase C-terminal domain-containing protein, partial [Streptomyces sp. NPDC054878]
MSDDALGPQTPSLEGEGTVDSENTPARPAPRKLASLGDLVGDALAPATHGLHFGLRDLDAATGGLQPGRLTLVAADPGAGGSLLALAAARHTALAARRPVLYAAAGLTTDVVTRWIIAAEAGVDVRRLRAGALSGPEHEATQAAAERVSQARDRVLFDDGTGLTAQAIAETAPYVDGLALVVVDRLHHAHDPHVPLSGAQVPPAVRTLAHLARELNVPVLAVLNTAAPDAVRSLAADVTLTLAPADDSLIAQVTVVERDLGQTTIPLRADLDRARFTDAASKPAPALPGSAASPTADTSPADTSALLAAERDLVEAALPFTSGAIRGLPAGPLQVLADHRQAVLSGATKDLPGLRGYSAALASAAGLILPDTPEGQQLRAALNAFATAYRATAAPITGAAPAPEDGAATGTVHEGSEAPTGETGSGSPAIADPPAETPAQIQHEDQDEDEDREQDLQPGDEEDEPDDAVFPALRLLKEAVGRSKMHPISVIRTEERDSGPWPLISEDMDGEPRWVHPEVTSERVAHINANGKRVRRDQLLVPDSFGDGVMCLIDRNGSYPSACSAVPLAPNKLLHTGPLDAFDKTQAGIYLIDVPEWTRTDMPHPLGRIIDRPDEDGRVWVTTPHIKQLEKLVRDNHLGAMPTIYDSWTGKYNESLFKPFYEA